MLDLEIVTPAIDTGLDIVSLPAMKKHLRLSASNTALDDSLLEAIEEVADKLHGMEGELNRTVFPMTWKRYLPAFPKGRIIRLPYPPLQRVVSISYDDDSSPVSTVPEANYIVRTNTLVGEIELAGGASWPGTVVSPRAVSITFEAGYTEYPNKLKRLIKILAAHYLENPEATINEPRQMMINRSVMFGVDDLRAALRIPVAYDNWIDD